MLVSWNWLREYVSVDASVDTATERLTMCGLNLEEHRPFGDDFTIDLEVTSNRPDCLGHLGVARELAAIYGTTAKIPNPQPAETGPRCSDQATVTIEAPEACSQYRARLIRGVKVGPSPKWLADRLAAIGLTSVNNVVDATNYVMMECAQPLHAFDFDRLRGGEIRVRRANAGESIVAINQKEYALPAGTCVIADAERAVAVAGVMGGFDTEIGGRTTNVLIEAASFAPLEIRKAARQLGLHSPSSYRFERALDRCGPDYASRRCCELILQIAGGSLQAGEVAAGDSGEPWLAPVELRFRQISRVLGYDVPSSSAVHILRSLGLKVVGDSGTDRATFAPPSCRRDLTREIDLIEEIARIHGYEKIPADAYVSLATSQKTRRERVMERVRASLTAAGFFEAVTLSFSSQKLAEAFQPRGAQPMLAVEHAIRKGEPLLRQSLIPSLLASARGNERQGTFGARLFETAKVFWAADSRRVERETEPTMIGCVTGQNFAELKGVVESLAEAVAPGSAVTMKPAEGAIGFARGRGGEVWLNNVRWGWLGELDRASAALVDLQDDVTVAELDFAVLEDAAVLSPQGRALPEFPAVSRDLNLVLDEAALWSDLVGTIETCGGPHLEAVRFGGQYRGQQIPKGKKSYLATLVFRAVDRTLTSDEIDGAVKSIVTQCGTNHGATLRA